MAKALTRVMFIDGSKEKFELLKKGHISAKFLAGITIEELLRSVNAVHELEDHDKAFIYALFLTAGRRDEVYGMRKMDIKHEQITDDEGRVYEVMVISLRNEKNRKIPYKFIPLMKGIDATEDYMIDKLIEHTATILNPEDHLFYEGYAHTTISNKHLEKVWITDRYREPNWNINEDLVIKFRLFPHYLRHIRLSELGLGEDTKIWAGWSEITPELDQTYLRRGWAKLLKIRMGMRRF